MKSLSTSLQKFELEELDGDSTANIQGDNSLPAARGEYPFLVSIAQANSKGPPINECTGTLIEPCVVLTSASCFTDCTGDFEPWDLIEFKRYNLTDATEAIDSRPLSPKEGVDVFRHPDFNIDGLLSNDFALVFLDEPVEGIMPIPLNKGSSFPADGDVLTAVGWGEINPIIYPDPEDFGPPYKVDIPDVPNDQCTESPYDYTEGHITDSMMCAGGDASYDGLCYDYGK